MQKVFFVTLLLLFSCKASYFDLKKDKVFVQASSKNIFDNEAKSSLTRVGAMSPWWQSLEDDIFQDYVAQMFKNNYSFKSAYENLVQAQENYNIARGGFWPAISADIGANRTITPTNSLAFGLGNSGKIYNTNYSSTLSASWQLDFFSKISNATKSAKNSYEASKSDVEALKHSLVADLFKAKINIALYHELLSLSQDNLADKKDIHNLIKRRYDLGVLGVKLDDVYASKNNFNNAKIIVSGYEKALEAQIFLFQSLLGKLPNKYGLNLDEFELIDVPSEILSCQSASLLDRRPDLRSLRYQIEAANLDVKVSIADLYPDFTISASSGFSGNKSRNLFEIDQLASSLSGNIATKLFQGGALRANIKMKKSILKQKVANYVSSVVGAISEVETLLKNDIELEKDFVAKIDSQFLLSKNTEFKEKRYKQGIESLHSYLSAKELRYNAHKDLLLKWQERWINRVNLYLALGGNWNNSNQCEG